MLDQLIGLLLLGLGLKTPQPNLNVKGDTTQVQEVNDEQEDEQEDSLTGTTNTALELKKDTRQIGTNKMGRTQDLKDLTRKKRELHRQLQEKLKENREQFHEEFKTKVEEAKKEQETLREQFKEKLETLRDEKKKTILENVENRLGSINAKRTSQMAEHLKKMSSILEKITQKATEAAAGGKTTTDIDAAVTKCQEIIATAQTAVSDQAGKAYTINITSESALKSNVGVATSGLQSDLTSVYQKVKGARSCTTEAVKALAHLLGEPTPKIIEPTHVPEP